MRRIGVSAIFTLVTAAYCQNTQPAQAPVLVTMTECEGVNNCAAWTFLGPQGNGQWPSGEVANLTVARADADSVEIHRADSTGSAAGLTAVYKGVRHAITLEESSHLPGRGIGKTNPGTGTPRWKRPSVLPP
jgi:hypothetical protein